MHLNNHGWGMRDMIIWTCILILFLLLATYLIMALYDNISISTNEEQNTQVETPVEKEEEPESPISYDYEYYKSAEFELHMATLNYLNDTKPDLSTGLTKITIDTLVEKGYTKEIYDETGEKTCSAYSSVYQDGDGDYIVTSRLNCGNYTTEGY